METLRSKKRKTLFIQLTLFVVTFITTTLAGTEWQYNKFLFYTDYSWNDFVNGMQFSIPFLLILTVHEFGHYITARLYNISVTLPYYIPLWFGFLGGPSIGTMGAFIRINEPIKTRKEFFDVGIAGPIAGFVVAIAVLYYGFMNLPPQEYIFEVHPEYTEYGLNYEEHVYTDQTANFRLGTNLIFEFFKAFVVPEEHKDRIPNAYEMIHYPFLFAGYLALFFTAINLLPIGQLDGGHVLYGMLGPRRHGIVSLTLFIIFVTYAGIGLFSPHQFRVMDEEAYERLGWAIVYIGALYFVFYSYKASFGDRMVMALLVFALQFMFSFFFPEIQGSNQWLLFAFIIGRFLGIYHPPALYDYPLDTKRIVLGVIALIIFLISFTPAPFVFE